MAGKNARAEDQVQRAVVQYLQHLENLGKLTFFHVPNGGRRSRIEAAIMVGLGVRKGVHDLVILLPEGRSCWLELKKPGGVVSDDQKRWHNQLLDFGFASFQVDSVAAAVAIIDALPGVRRAA